jgi:uncharacterized repeat protein (TIGR01451 family)
MASSGGPDHFGYTFNDSNLTSTGGPTYNWIEISGTGNQTLNNSDDSVQSNINLGFFFNYYGTDYSHLAIANNGLLFSTGTTTQYDNQHIGQTPGVHGFIAPFWDDITTWGEGRIYYQTLGTFPNRMFVVEWLNNHHYSSSAAGVTFESILYEGSNNIKFQYKNVTFDNVSGNNINKGGSATIGIESPNGTDGVQYSYNQQTLYPGLAILFKFPQYAGVNLNLAEQAPVSKDHGKSMTYTFYCHNFGNQLAHNVTLQDRLPNGVVFDSASDSGVYDSSTGIVTWSVGSIDAMSSVYRTANVTISDSVSVGTAIVNNANISTSDLEVRYDDNAAQASTIVTGSSLPSNVGVEPNNGGIGTVSVYWHSPIKFSYHSDKHVTGVNITIHIDDGGPDIKGSMTPTTDSTSANKGVMMATASSMTGSSSDWSYTTTFYPRHGSASVTYAIDTSSVTYPVYVDPAGYIYDIDTGQRIAGASVWLQRPDGSGGWKNVSMGENPPVSQPDTNPLVSDKNGGYQWDVLSGSYRVHVEAPGYEPVNSIVVSIPPPVTDLNVGLHHINNIVHILPAANFTTDVSSGYAPLSVYFTDHSKYATRWNWNFGDGTTSADRYPIHTYSAPGNYIVKLTASNGNGENSSTKTITVQGVPIASLKINDFTAKITNGNAPLGTEFRSNVTGTNIIKWRWIFESTAMDYYSQHGATALHTFTKPGIYDITLTVWNSAGQTDTMTKRAYITVFKVNPPKANFVGTPTSGKASLTVQFTDKSTNNPTSWSWSFGDKSTSTVQNPMHKYTKKGTYIVSLKVKNSAGSSSVTKSKYITVR